MIEELRITNLGVIENAQVAFGPGLNSLTGETGAGKTMALTSLAMLMGHKIDSAKVRTGADVAIVEGTFLVAVDSPAVEIVRNAGGDVDIDDEHAAIYISRHVPAQGRTRAYVGGHAVPLAVLKELSEHLVTVHGQADQLRLKSVSAQRQALDSFGGPELAQALDAYHVAWAKYQEAERKFVEFQHKISEASTQRLALEAFIKRVDAIEPHLGEEDELKDRALFLENIEDVRLSITSAVHALDDDTNGALLQLDVAANELAKISENDGQIQAMVALLRDISSQASDISNDLGSRLESLDADPHQLNMIHERRAELRALQRDLGLSIPEILERRARADDRLQEILDPQATLDDIERELEQAQQEVRLLGKNLFKTRVKYAQKMSKSVTGELVALAMKDATFSVEVTAADSPHSQGLDAVEFKLSPHRGSPLLSLGSTASGGEMSRVMLALEVVIAQGNTAAEHTFIFDEVDAGIGGKTALSIGQRLSRLGTGFQVIAVTHLAQVAAYSARHITVRKDPEAGGGTTEVRVLNDQERTAELARMLSGHTESEAALAHAAELLLSVHVS
ncbi:DNA repair protein RecN [Arcanobacterium phocisimile]|uniref:DNA repair protein RecN n=1 Tax=Arcanobacterium phocisimile TaxID=1302235 RepID=A0ABX7IE79_9ACTO|nr:DNA repair protein RecN [Arcanobacterium phocisimile]QRV01444.1 DNA repair protein RecN [Arcanobacterium phocisimile]